jgi:hypothetical protein
MRENCMMQRERLGKVASSSDERKEGSEEIRSRKDNVKYPRLASQAAKKVVTSLRVGWTVK